MTERRRSSRNVHSCPQLSNPFHPSHSRQLLLSVIPASILEQIGHRSTILCSEISRLPSFQAKLSWELQLKLATLAADYQVQWQEELMTMTDRDAKMIEEGDLQDELGLQGTEQLGRVKRLPGRAANQVRSNIWDDSDFLERLNDFILGKKLSGKSAAEIELRLQS